jgi:hypothetical protein
VPLALHRVLYYVTGPVSIDLTIVAPEGVVVPIVGVSRVRSYRRKALKLQK